MINVDRYTRARKGNRTICCPHCKTTTRVGHFSWSAIVCMSCRKDVAKYEWKVAE